MKVMELLRRPVRRRDRRGQGFWIRTIKSQILLAFLTMSLITASLGLFSIRDLRREGALVDRTFDQSLMSINYARAALADFNGLQAAFARRMLTREADDTARLDRSIADLKSSMADDLSIAVERALSDRVTQAAARVQDALKTWDKASGAIVTSPDQTAAWRALDRSAAAVAQQLDLLINYTAGDGFIYRQNAHRTVREDVRFNMLALGLALIISALIAGLLARRILIPIKKASDVARQIAGGRLTVVVPPGEADELGALLAAMETMRCSIKTSMDREVAMRQSAQTRLADALESSSEGIVVVDAEGTIALANAQATMLLASASGPVRAGDAAERLVACISTMQGSILEQTERSATREAELPDGRWLRISRNTTQDGGSIIVYSDISLVKAQQSALEATNIRLDVALANLSQGLCLFDRNNTLQVFNQRFCEIFGLPLDKVSRGQSLRELVELGFATGDPSEYKDAFLSRVETRVEERRPVKTLLRLSADRIISLSHQPLEDGAWLATYEDVTDRLEAEQKIAFMARHDALTGLPNRVLFAERVDIALAAAARGDGFALLYIDLDNFKHVNDTLGHPVGDELLRLVADSLRECIRETDMVARLGGDEFAVVQTHLKNPQDAASLARRIVDILNVPFAIEGNRVMVGASLGISLAPGDGTSYGKLLKNADVALYKAKADGRNTWRFFESEMDERLQVRRLLELDLREAIEKEQLELYYQPIVNIASDRICGMEALIRWRHPVRGLVSPSDFVPIAEEIGLITTIGNWVLARACRDAVTWPSYISVAVNVSAAQFREGRLVHQVIEALYASGLSATRLGLEITESVLLVNTSPTLDALNKLREIGIKISMDDFGTGYSSLSYLRSFSFDKVKIDQSFTRDLNGKPESSAIVHTIIELCTTLGMRVTAEGVETEAQLAFLKDEHCHEAQGYYFSEPVPGDQVLDLVRTGEARRRSGSAASHDNMRVAV